VDFDIYEDNGVEAVTSWSNPVSLARRSEALSGASSQNPCMKAAPPTA